MRGGVPHGPEICHRVVLLFMNDLPDALEALTLLIAYDVKLVTPRPQNMDLHSCRITAWDSSQKLGMPVNFAKCNSITIGQDVPLRLPVFPARFLHP